MPLTSLGKKNCFKELDVKFAKTEEELFVFIVEGRVLGLEGMSENLCQISLGSRNRI